MRSRELPGPGQPLRGDRIHRYVTAFCPRCHDTNPPLSEVRRLSGALLVRDGRVWLERGCPEHGLVRTLYDESPEILRYLEKWQAPTKQHVPDRAGNFRPVPEAYAYGLPAMQTQHTCILLQDIIEHCNLKCPTCFTASGPQLQGVAPLEEVLANIDTRLARENDRLDVLMLSGGEPTLYPYLAELLDELMARPIVRIMVNSNGMLIATDDELHALLARHRDRVEVYLQYDGSSREASIHHRGGDLTRYKDAAISRLSAAGIFTTLTMTASLGVNDSEIGDVVMRALETPFVGGVALQPVFGSGRGHGIDPLDRLTHTGVLDRLKSQTGGVVSWHDLTALPCSHPHCASVGYMLKDDAGTWRSLAALIGHDQLLAWLELNPDSIANRNADHPGRRQAARPAAAPAPAPRRAGHQDHGQALHGHVHHDRGTAHAVLRPRRHQGRRRGAPVRALLRRPGVAGAGAAADEHGDRSPAAPRAPGLGRIHGPGL